VSANITAQFIEQATTHSLGNDMVTVELKMGGTGWPGGYGGAVSIVLRTQEEAQTLLDAAQAALYLLTTEDVTQ
jgi:hypothetical protein